MNSPPEVAAEPAPASPWRRRLGFLAGLLVLVFLAIALVNGWSAVSEYDWELQPGLLALGCAVLLVFYLASGVGYIAIIDRLHHGGPSPLVMLDIWARSLLGRYVPGNVLMVVGRVVLSYERGRAAALHRRGDGLRAGADGRRRRGGRGRLRRPLQRRRGRPAVAARPAAARAASCCTPRFFGPATAWVLRGQARAAAAPAGHADPDGRLVGWYTLTAAVLRPGDLAPGAVGGGRRAGDPAFVGLAFLLSFAVSMIAFIFPSGLGVREGVFALALAQNVPGRWRWRSRWGCA